MSFAHFTESGFEAFCDSGIVNMQDDCPCVQCGDYDKYSIIYVDKHATGTGDGSSWENAYTDIQTAINNNLISRRLKKQIQIKGYGESDCYPAGISLPECGYLNGVNTGDGDVWVGGSGIFASRGVECGSAFSESRIDNINVKDCYYGFFIAARVNNCTVKECDYGFFRCRYCDTCIAQACRYGFENTIEGALTDCRVDGNDSDNLFFNLGYYDIYDSTLTRCVAKNTRNGYLFHVRCTLVNCEADAGLAIILQGGNGFRGDVGGNTYINCVAHGFNGCGFYSEENATYIGCSEYNNCGGDCSSYDCATI